VLCLSGTKILLVQDELPKQQVTVLPHHPCSLDLTPCDFFFFPRLKEKLRVRRFQSSEEIVAATREAVWDLSANNFHQCFQQLYQSWQTCIAAKGDCFEGECEYV
jgi:histone-lysine N-methyltransferase SETMAR